MEADCRFLTFKMQLLGICTSSACYTSRHCPSLTASLCPERPRIPIRKGYLHPAPWLRWCFLLLFYLHHPALSVQGAKYSYPCPVPFLKLPKHASSQGRGFYISLLPHLYASACIVKLEKPMAFCLCFLPSFTSSPLPTWSYKSKITMWLHIRFWKISSLAYKSSHTMYTKIATKLMEEKESNCNSIKTSNSSKLLQMLIDFQRHTR